MSQELFALIVSIVFFILVYIVRGFDYEGKPLLNLLTIVMMIFAPLFLLNAGQTYYDSLPTQKQINERNQMEGAS
jgi:hypothetical protein